MDQQSVTPNRNGFGMTSKQAGTAPRDNYAQFLARLDAASASIVKRRASGDRTIEIVTLMYKRNDVGYRLWSERRSQVNGLLDAYSTKPTVHRPLWELHENAVKMEHMFGERTRRLLERLTYIRGRCAELDSALLDLEASKEKLNVSRMLSQDRESLNKALADLAGTPEHGSRANPTSGVSNDLRDARQAVILAEALMEVKGH